MSELYETSAALFQALNDEERLQLRVRIVDTNRLGAERVLDDVEHVDVQEVHPADRRHIRQIHRGRLNVETAAGSRVVAQVLYFILDFTLNI